ncbi:MAG: DUF58 domain-containing protein [Senegalia sp. (in: firmicutes)]|uniref:DUF58 domain-containing protein n=1 Tax=Senegalia sp. (in: firmicutes) TaxID=1924098 RepID=UPI003F96B053
MIFISILFFIIISFLLIRTWPELSIKNVRYNRFIDKDIVFPNEEIVITTVISNHKIIPLPWIEMYSELSEPIKYIDQSYKYKKNINTNIYKVITSLLPFQKVTRKNKFYINKRGYYNIDNIRLTIGDFIGISKGLMNIKSPISIVVYPEIKNINDLIVDENEPQGEISVNRFIISDPLAIKGVREYNFNDSFNIIDWKATARFNNLYVKDFDFTSEKSIQIILNVQCNEIPWADNDEYSIEKGVDISAAIMNDSIESGIPVGFSTNSILLSDNLIEEKIITISPNTNINIAEEILNILARISLLFKVKVSDLLYETVNNYKRDTTFILITPYLDEKTIEIINEYLYVGYSIKLILLRGSSNDYLLDENIEIFSLKELYYDL